MSLMANIKRRSDNFISRLNDRLDDWSEKHLPDWLYKQVTFQPDRAWKPENFKQERAFILLLIRK